MKGCKLPTTPVACCKLTALTHKPLSGFPPCPKRHLRPHSYTHGALIGERRHCHAGILLRPEHYPVDVGFSLASLFLNVFFLSNMLLDSKAPASALLTFPSVDRGIRQGYFFANLSMVASSSVSSSCPSPVMPQEASALSMGPALSPTSFMTWLILFEGGDRQLE